MPISSELKKQILNYIKQPIPQNDKMPIVLRSVPVPFFGDIENATVATISINPSNREFEDDKHKLLIDPNKRITDRDKLKRTDTESLKDEEAEQVYNSLIHYFDKKRNPYKAWFDPLNKQVGHMFKCSYYNGTMVHLDIYPWATQKKWDDKEHKNEDKQSALQNYNLLKKILLNKNFDYVYINGCGVKKQLIKYFGKEISEEPIIHTKNVCHCVHNIYKDKLKNTMLIGTSCYVQNTRETKAYLTELHNILANREKLKQSKNNDSVVIENPQPEKSSDKPIWYKNIETYVSNFKGYACTDWKQKYLITVLDILRIYGTMTANEVREKCFKNYDKYGLEETQDNKKIIYECLYQHANCNCNKDAERHYKFFIRDSFKRYTLDPNIKLW